LANQYPKSFADNPVDELKEHVWIAPYYEEDVKHLANTIGTDRILFGSDWPHGEGLEDPTSYVQDLAGLSSDDEIRKVMRGNALDLLGVSVPSIP
ncbi:amidohydrolase family protein, partial [Streptomyces sp. SID10244]|nr:amidohydrolase family protein [Streptomyces sp. SID10244]